MKPIKRLQIGKNRISDAFVEQVRSVFKNERIVKISILKSACRDKDDAKKMAEELIRELGGNFDYKLVGYVLTVMRFRKNKE